MNPLDKITENLRKTVLKTYPSARKIIDRLKLEDPPEFLVADLCFSVYFLSNNLKGDPSIIAKHITKKIRENFSSYKFLTDASSDGPYVNLKLNRNLFEQSTIEYVTKNYKTIPRKKSSRVYLNYNIDYQEAIKPQNLQHLFLVGGIISRTFEADGAKVTHYVYVSNAGVSLNKKLLRGNIRNLLGKNTPKIFYQGEADRESNLVVDKAIKNNYANFVSNTKAVISHSEKTSAELILRRNDESLTKSSQYLGYIKKSLAKDDPILVINITNDQDILGLESIFTLSRKLHLIPQKTALIFLPIKTFELDIPPNNLSMLYGVAKQLSTSSNRAQLSDLDIFTYKKIEKLTKKLSSSEEDIKYLDLFEITKLISKFSSIVHETARYIKPSLLFNFVDELMSASERLHVERSRNLSRAVGVVLKKCISIILP